MDDLPFLPVIYGSKLLEMMEEERLPVDLILSECGINRSVFLNPEGLMSIRQTLLLLSKYLGLTGSSFPAVRYGRRLGLVEHGILGFVFTWRGSFRDMLGMILSYFRVRFPLVSIDMVHEKEYFALRFECHDKIKPYEAFLLQAFISSFYENGSKLTKNIVVHCKSNLFGDMKLLHSALPAQVHDDHDFNELRFYASEAYMRGGDKGPMDAGGNADPFQEHAVVVRLRSFLLSHVGRNQSAEDVATHLGMSERTLRRRLADAGMSFNRIRMDVRMQVAERYLKTSDMSIERIADMVGYSDQATFTRAFGEWSELTPLAVRRLHRRSKAPLPLKKVLKMAGTER
jgi:AraC-like DNA-binding protein